MITIPSLVEEHAIQKLREEELEEARAIQDVMMPVAPLQTPAFSICHEFQPLTAVGGDFLDYFQLDDGCVGIYLGDVSGKGLPAAMYAALTVGTLRGVHKTGQLPSSVLETLNKRLTIRGVPRRHAALLYAVFNPANGEMRIASAGMPGPLHLSGSQCQVLEVSGIPPGLFSHATYETTVLSLRPGDSVLFYTDGITEAVNARYEDFGVERVSGICATRQDVTPTQLLQSIFSAVHEFSDGFRQHDDMAAALFHFFG